MVCLVAATLLRICSYVKKRNKNGHFWTITKKFQWQVNRRFYLPIQDLLSICLIWFTGTTKMLFCRLLLLASFWKKKKNSTLVPSDGWCTLICSAVALTTHQDRLHLACSICWLMIILLRSRDHNTRERERFFSGEHGKLNNPIFKTILYYVACTAHRLSFKTI